VISVVNKEEDVLNHGGLGAAFGRNQDQLAQRRRAGREEGKKIRRKEGRRSGSDLSALSLFGRQRLH
jgi:hypothetical protein